MKTIPQRELRKRTSHALRRVEAGECMRIAVNSRPVADLVPVRAQRRNFVPREELLQLLKRTPLDPEFRGDIQAAAGATTVKL